jgi:hypothetical protein
MCQDLCPTRREPVYLYGQVTFVALALTSQDRIKPSLEGAAKPDPADQTQARPHCTVGVQDAAAGNGCASAYPSGVAGTGVRMRER